MTKQLPIHHGGVNEDMKVLAILQARVSSSRLPGKVLLPILGEPMLFRQIERIHRAKRIEQLVVATSTDASDDVLASECATRGIYCFRGSLDDVLDRYYHAALGFQPANVVRLTGDCPLTDPELIDRVIGFHLQGAYDFVSNAINPTFPDGLDAVIFRFHILEQAWREARLPSEREHVSLFMKNRPERYRIANYEGSPDRSDMRWTVDEPSDFEFVQSVYSHLYPDKPDFGSEDIYHLLEQRPELQRINSSIGRNEGLLSSLRKDQEWKSANEESKP